MKQPCVYLLASQHNGTLYIGVTSDLVRPVWYEIHETMESAISREKQLKKWSMVAKIGLIEQKNPTWQDLWLAISSYSAN